MARRNFAYSSSSPQRSKLPTRREISNSSSDDEQLLSFTSILREVIKLKLDFPSIKFKQNSYINIEGEASTATKQDRVLSSSNIHDRLMNSGVEICKEINSGENIMFNVTFSCQASQPYVFCRESRPCLVYKSKVDYPEKNMPIDSLRIEICFNYRKSITEICKYTNYGTQKEEELINSLITVIDHDDHQVYFKLKTNYFNGEQEQLYRYIVIGKMDDSQHAFIFDVSNFAERREIIPKNLKHIYSLCMPHDLAKYFETVKDASSTNSDTSVRRVGFGMFFRADTKSERYRYRGYYRDATFHPIDDTSQIALVGKDYNFGDYGIQILAETTTKIYYKYYTGVIDVGYYKFKACGWVSYESWYCADHYTCKLAQQVKYLQ